MPRATEQQSSKTTAQFVCTHARYHGKRGGIATSACTYIESKIMETGDKQVTVTSLVPFEELPNLPKAVIPQIDLGVEHVDLEALALKLK